MFHTLLLHIIAYFYVFTLTYKYIRPTYYIAQSNMKFVSIFITRLCLSVYISSCLSHLAVVEDQCNTEAPLKPSLEPSGNKVRVCMCVCVCVCACICTCVYVCACVCPCFLTNLTNVQTCCL